MAGRLEFMSEGEVRKLEGQALTLDMQTQRRVNAAKLWAERSLAGTWHRTTAALTFADVRCLRCRYLHIGRGLTIHSDRDATCPKCKTFYWDRERYDAARVIYEVSKNLDKYLEMLHGT